MIVSMTGYGRAEKAWGKGRSVVEISSVNSRFLEYQIRLPKTLAELEPKIKGVLSSRLSRGKIYFSLVFEDESPDYSRLTLDTPKATMYYGVLKELKELFQLPGEIRLEHFVSLPDLIKSQVQTVDVEKIWRELAEVVDAALENLCRMRQQEGAGLCADFRARLGLISDLLEQIRRRFADCYDGLREKLRSRITDALRGIPLDDTRLAMEAAILADRLDISEEITRLGAHLEAFRQALDGNDAVGKRLTFIIQEMNREANTIGAKAADYQISALVIKIKEELEKLREQAQNVE